MSVRHVSMWQNLIKSIKQSRTFDYLYSHQYKNSYFVAFGYKTVHGQLLRCDLVIRTNRASHFYLSVEDTRTGHIYFKQQSLSINWLNVKDIKYYVDVKTKKEVYGL